MNTDETPPPPGNLNAPLGMGSRAADPVWAVTYKAIAEAGFEKVSHVSSGGFGCLLRGYESRARKWRALKVTKNPDSQRSLLSMDKEIKRLAAELPSVCRLYTAHSKVVDGKHAYQPFLVLEWIDGLTIDAYAQTLGSFAKKLRLAIDYLEAVAKVHASGLSLGDISCRNTMVERSGRIRFVDLGQAGNLDGSRSLNSFDDGPNGSAVAAPGGTPGFATQERLAGAPSTEPRELHSVAAVLYVLFTGKLDAELSQWRSRLDGVGVPKTIAAMLIDLRQESAKASLQDTEPDHLREGASKLATAMVDWQRTQRRIRQAAWSVAIMTLLGLCGAWGGWELWTAYSAVVAGADQARVKELDRQLALRPNRSHPAVARSLQVAEQVRTRWLEELRSGAERAAQQSVGELLSALQATLSISHEMEGVDPVRALLGEVLLRTPWVKTCPTIAKEHDKLSKQYQRLGEQVDAGEWRTAWAGLRSLQADLARLAAENVAAARAEQARAEYRRLERGVSARLREESQFAMCSQRAEEAERLLLAGQFADTAGPGATSEFGRAKEQLEAFLVKAETDAERRTRLVADTTRITELETRIAALEGEVLQLTALREDLAAKLAAAAQQLEVAEAAQRELQTKVGTLRQELAAKAAAFEVERRRLQEELASAAKQREAAESARGELLAELEGMAKAKAVADAEVMRVRSEVASGQASVLQNQVPPTVVNGVIPARFTNGLGMEMIQIKPCTFWMGSPENEAWRQSNEKLREVTIKNSYWPAKTEVTQSEYFRVMGKRPWRTEMYVMEGDDVAANYISWTDAVEFCRKLTQGERAAKLLPAGYEYRLPTEAECECMARAGTRTRYSFGDNGSKLGEFAVFGESRTGMYAHRVMTKKPNAWGFYDVHGNVWEWCLELYEGGPHRVLRGGSWGNNSDYCRSAYRHWLYPTHRGSHFGFRVVLAPVL